ncbi:transposable element Tcb1 transposase [Brachionus plicatilis]|uniref:Transposable element Tcb1 transposase n=1 Tax=Brachionus plicatilis TaxID=10195 RepID=A0A3M7QZV6_BRAPC|nr:transposable element Tcb1 transposase [Brachionus plicatilis]
MRRHPWSNNYQDLVDPESLPIEISRTFLERSESILQQALDSKPLILVLNFQIRILQLKKPLLTVLDRSKRLKWCKERQRWTVNDWSKVVFSDESNFEPHGFQETNLA